MADLDRREWLMATGAMGVGAIAYGRGAAEPGASTDAGAAVCEATEDAMLVALWARRARAARVAVRAGGETSLHEVAIAGATTVDVGGLDGDTYDVAITFDDGTELALRGRLAPAPDDTRPVRIAAIADVDPNPEFATDVCEHVVAARPDLLVGLGDFPYTDNGPPAMTPATYRDRHAEMRTHPPIRALLEAMPVRAIYDDHEFRNDWDAALAAGEPDRCRAALAAWDEFFPTRCAGDVRYRRWRQGAHAECFLLDCRRFRSANADPDGPDKTMLGATQRAWLVDALARSTATFKLVFTSVPLDFGHGDDHWAGYTHERDAIFDAIVATGVRGIVFLSADQHWFAAHRHAYGIRELQFGPLARGIFEPPPAAPGVLFRAREYNALLVDVDGDALEVSAIGPGGVRLYAERLTVDDLTPRRSAT